MGDDSAIDELIRRASDPAVSSESLREAIGPALATLSPDDRPGAEAMLRRLAEEVIDAPTRPDVAGTIALCCGTLVERGLDPTIALGPILDRLESQIAPEAIAFVAACRQAAEDDRRHRPKDEPEQEEGEEEQTDPVERHGERIAALMPTEAQSFHALERISLAAIAMLGRSVEARKASWSRTALRASLDELGGQYGYAGLLWMMMQVLDDEPIVVLHPPREGLPGANLGAGRQLPAAHPAGRRVDRPVLEPLAPRPAPGAGRGRRSPATGRSARTLPPAHGSFNLWTWRGLKPDGTLPDVMSDSAPTGSGTRVCPPTSRRSRARGSCFSGRRPMALWNAIRKFPAMPGDLRVEQILTPDEVRDLLGRIAAAVAE